MDACGLRGSDMGSVGLGYASGAYTIPIRSGSCVKAKKVSNVGLRQLLCTGVLGEYQHVGYLDPR